MAVCPKPCTSGFWANNHEQGADHIGTHASRKNQDHFERVVVAFKRTNSLTRICGWGRRKGPQRGPRIVNDPPFIQRAFSAKSKATNVAVNADFLATENVVTLSVCSKTVVGSEKVKTHAHEALR